DFLLADHVHAGRSFFEAIEQVRPGHFVEAGDGQLLERRYFLPRAEPPADLQPAEAHERWRHHFRAAVGRRLGAEGGVAAHLSGGLDSTSVIRVAHDIYAEAPAGRPSFTTLS